MALLANVVAIGAVTGFTGNDKPLKALMRDLTGEKVRSSAFREVKDVLRAAAKLQMAARQEKK